MPFNDEFSCFKTKSSSKKQLEQQNDHRTAPSSLSFNQNRQSKTSIVDRFRSFESIFNSCLKSNQSSSSSLSSKKQHSKKYFYDNNQNNIMPTSRTNETFSNDDEEPPPTVSTSSVSTSTYLNKQKSSFDVANQQVSLNASLNQKLSDESFRNILLVSFVL